MSARGRSLAVALAVLAGTPVSAHAFGTVNFHGQSAEHERITRAAVWCDATGAPRQCFEDWSAGQLAGDHGSLGAVGAPDIDSATSEQTHCDNSDYLAYSWYPQTRAEATSALLACRSYASKQLQTAVRAAKDMLDRSGRLIQDEVEDFGACGFVGPGTSGGAKCAVLDHFGRTLHTAEDFYSHTNWADEANPNEPLGENNPPGLNQPGLTSLFDYDSTPSIPDQLSGGCFSFEGDSGCRSRVTHEWITKDEGDIDPRTGAATNPTTPRGKVGANFAKAVSGAIREARRQWDVLQKRLIDTYGKRKGHLMVCALTRDHPYEDCQVKLTLEGKQVVTWSEDVTLPGACGGHVTGSGSTTIEFTSTHPVYASPVDLVPPQDDGVLSVVGRFFFPPGVTLPTTAHFTSGGTTSSEGPACASGGGTPTPPDCGKKTVSLPLEVVSEQEDRLTLHNHGDPPDPYKNCPAGAAQRGAIGPDDAELDDDDLFDPNQAKLIVVGKRRHTETTTLTGGASGTETVTTALDWTLTIEKPPPKRASAARRRAW